MDFADRTLPQFSPLALDLRMDFITYIAAHTNDFRAKADRRYIPRAAAAWTFDGSHERGRDGQMRRTRQAMNSGTDTFFVDIQGGAAIPDESIFSEVCNDIGEKQEWQFGRLPQ